MFGKYPQGMKVCAKSKLGEGKGGSRFVAVLTRDADDSSVRGVATWLSR